MKNFIFLSIAVFAFSCCQKTAKVYEAKAEMYGLTEKPQAELSQTFGTVLPVINSQSPDTIWPGIHPIHVEPNFQLPYRVKGITYEPKDTAQNADCVLKPVLWDGRIYQIFTTFEAKKAIDKISILPGVESVLVHSRYTIWVEIGEAFNAQTVLSTVVETCKKYCDDPSK